jgi:protein-disulfide isomerase
MLSNSMIIKNAAFGALLVSALALSACNDDKKAEVPAKPAVTEEAAKPAETKPAETAAAETKPAETAAAETKPAETAAAPAETKPAEAAAAVEVPKPDGTVDLAQLMAPGPMTEMSLGNADAKVTIIEYASMTCGHCGAFHASTYPALKEKYVDTGKVRFIFREYPFDPLAEAGFLLARCNEAQFFPMISALFSSQAVWVKAEKPSEALFQISKQAGYTQETFNACLQNTALLEKIRAVRAGGEKNGVDSTPTFFVNGAKYPGNKSIEVFSAIIDPLLK